MAKLTRVADRSILFMSITALRSLSDIAGAMPAQLMLCHIVCNKPAVSFLIRLDKLASGFFQPHKNA